jgi:hypothetical protein
MEKILTINIKYNIPATQKQLPLALAEGIQATLKDVKEFLAGSGEEKKLKESKNRRKEVMGI